MPHHNHSMIFGISISSLWKWFKWRLLLPSWLHIVLFLVQSVKLGFHAAAVLGSITFIFCIFLGLTVFGSPSDRVSNLCMLGAGFSPCFRGGHKHFCLQTSDLTSHKLVCFKHTLAFTIYVLMARESSFVFSLCLHKLAHPANQAGNLDWNVRGQWTAGSLISDTSSGDRKWTGRRGRKWQFFHLHLIAGFDLNFSPVLTKANLWAVEATPNLEIMTYGAFYAWINPL